MNSRPVRIKGIASAASSVVRVSVEGNNLPLKAARETTARQLTRLPNSQRSVAFETTIKVRTNTGPIVVEAEDKLGSRTRVLVPVLNRSVEATPIRGQKYALIIGVSRYKNNGKGINNLEFADVDATALYEFLQTPAAGKFARENMLLLTNEQATNASIREALTNFVARAAVNDLLLIFFAGHGAADPYASQNLYVITHDTSVTNMPQTALLMSDLRAYLDNNVKSKRLILLLDACHSAGISTEGARTLPEQPGEPLLADLALRREGKSHHHFKRHKRAFK